MKICNLPKKAGWYWWRNTHLSGQGCWKCCRVWSRDGVMLVAYTDGERYPVSEVGGEWIPIKEPHE